MCVVWENERKSEHCQLVFISTATFILIFLFNNFISFYIYFVQSTTKYSNATYDTRYILLNSAFDVMWIQSNWKQNITSALSKKTEYHIVHWIFTLSLEMLLFWMSISCFRKKNLMIVNFFFLPQFLNFVILIFKILYSNIKPY